MKESLKVGLEHELWFGVHDQKTVPALYPESPEFQIMPKVFATGFMVGFIEWACIEALKPHLDWPNEQTVGTQINVSHIAATPPGMDVVARVKLIEIDGRKLVFQIEAKDGKETISKGTHERFVINAEKFNAKIQEKAQSFGI